MNRALRALVLPAALLLAPAAAHTQGFSSTNVQLLGAWDAHDWYYGENTVDGEMLTLTLEHVSGWAYGDVFFFVDYFAGDFADDEGEPTGEQFRLYSEFAPRLSLSAVTGETLAWGPVADVYVAGQVNRGANFNAVLLGLSTDLRVPHVPLLQVSAYLRDDNFNDVAAQLTTVWSAPFTVGPLAGVFEGWIDVAGTDELGADILSQPQLLLDLGALAGRSPGSVLAGVEWYLHRNDIITESYPQAMVKYRW